MKQFGIGQPIRRVEDRRFLTGSGRYLDDIVRPRQAHAAMLRSPHAHARIRAIDTAAALAAPGVLAVLTGEDLARDGIGTIPCVSGLTNRDGSPMAVPPRPALVARPGAACRRHGGDGRRRDRRAGARRRRADRGRLRAAAGGRRNRRRRSTRASPRCGTSSPAICASTGRSATGAPSSAPRQRRGIACR